MKRGYCGQCYPSSYRCAESLPLRDKLAHRMQFLHIYGLDWKSLLYSAAWATYCILGAASLIIINWWFA